MYTHENEVPENDLPGAGMLDADFARRMLREGEERGLLAWNEDDQTYEKTARTFMVEVAQTITEKAHSLDPQAGPEETLALILSCIPMIAGYELRETDEDGNLLALDETWTAPETFDLEDWR